MKRRLFKTLVAVLAIAAAAAGPVRGQNASPDVTLDFTTNDWGIPEGNINKTYAANSYTSGDYTITLQGGGSSNGYYFSSGFLMLGKSGAYLELPEFESAVDSIVVVGNNNASSNVKQNIYVGETAVSTQTTGAKETNTYVIDENYRAAGNIYTLKVDNAYNTQITYIKVYYVSSGGGSTPEPPAPPTPHTVRFAAGNDGWQVQDVTASASAVAPAVLQNVMAGDSLVVTAPTPLPGKVKSVKAVKYVAPPSVTDLATITENYTASDGEILTGTLGANVKISIADGATVTLDGVTINGVNNQSYNWAGINCLGDATIILSGTNTVKGFNEDYPGIHVPQNKTLTIQGSGSLTASSRGFACGIGGGNGIACGNIVIAGGTITATGGGDAAGIGGGFEAGCGNISITGGTITANDGGDAAGIGSGNSGSCGNISITGGTVTATGSYFAAGIGSGNSGSCGTITITNGVTSLTATKGNYANYSIGFGSGGSCGTVTIGGTVGAITTSPYTYTPGN